MKKAIIIISLLLIGISTIKAQQIASSSFGKGVQFLAKDSTMSLKLNLRMQTLFEGEYDEPSNSWSSDFLIRRWRLKFDGFVYNPKLTYKVELGLSNKDISISKEDGNTSGGARLILDAVLKYQVQKHWSFWVGQTKLPGNRERVVSSADLQFVDRSLVNSYFNIDRDMGIQLHGKYTIGKNFQINPKFAFTQGEGRNITSGNFGGFNYTGRVDFLPLGAFEGKKQDYILSDLTRQSKPKLAVGFTYNYNDRAVRQQGQLGSFVEDSLGNYVQNSLTALEADLLFKYKGISILAEYANTTAAQNYTDVSKKFNTGGGLNTQLGYLFKNNVEIAGRFTTIKPNNNFSAIKNTNEYTLALSKYIVGHNLKVQSDASLIEINGGNSIRMRMQVEMQF